jgi:hypothetical protein
MPDGPVLLYDGLCGFCDGTVQFILKHDRRGTLRFATLQGDFARDVIAPEPVPPFANTAMDGYAVRAADTKGATADAPLRLRVVGELPAGQAPTTAVGVGEAIRIMTGAPIPPGADAVVMVERTSTDGDVVSIAVEAKVGEHLRDAGGDVGAGDEVFAAGTVLTPAHLGVLASIDMHEVEGEAMRLAEMQGLRVRGAMTIARLGADESELRETFAAVRDTCRILAQAGHPATELSMGMSNDFEIAVEEGATMVRLGSILFGAREQ